MTKANYITAVLRGSLLGCVLCLCGCRPPADIRLCNAVKAGDTNYLQQHMSSGGGINSKLECELSSRRRTATPLTFAIYCGQPGIIEWMLKNGADPNLPDAAGEPPLIWVIRRAGGSENEQVQKLKLLLEAGANPNQVARNGVTPLTEAAMLGETEQARVLLKAGANVNAPDSAGNSPLHLALNEEMAKLLIESGASLTSRNTSGETPVASLQRLGHFETLKVLTNAPAGNSEVRQKTDN